MATPSEIDVLIGQIRDTINRRSDGSLSLEKTRQVYGKLLERYRTLERKFVSDHPEGFIKGLLYNHTISNYAVLTALFVLKEGIPSPLVFAGDAILLHAIPELITRDSDNPGRGDTSRVVLGEESNRAFSMALKRMEARGETLIVASVTSTPLFDMADFEFLADLIGDIYRKHTESFSPVLLDYVNDISSGISGIFNSTEGVLYADHFTLHTPLASLSLSGFHSLIDFSAYIEDTLKRAYPEPVRVFVVSLASYCVLYDENAPLNAGVKRNRIDFNYHTNIVPYRVTHTAIDTLAALALFLENLR